MEKFVLSVLVENKAGVLSRVSGLFSRRGYNIDSLTVCETSNPLPVPRLAGDTGTRRDNAGRLDCCKRLFGRGGRDGGRQVIPYRPITPCPLPVRRDRV